MQLMIYTVFTTNDIHTYKDTSCIAHACLYRLNGYTYVYNKYITTGKAVGSNLIVVRPKKGMHQSIRIFTCLVEETAS